MGQVLLACGPGAEPPPWQCSPSLGSELAGLRFPGPPPARGPTVSPGAWSLPRALLKQRLFKRPQCVCVVHATTRHPGVQQGHGEKAPPPTSVPRGGHQAVPGHPLTHTSWVSWGRALAGGWQADVAVLPWLGVTCHSRAPFPLLRVPKARREPGARRGGRGCLPRARRLSVPADSSPLLALRQPPGRHPGAIFLGFLPI